MNPMTKLLIIVLLFLGLHKQSFCQSWCNISTWTVDTVFYPNTTTNFNNPNGNLTLYLCGPGTTVYDTAQPYCRTVLQNSGTTYLTNATGCAIIQSYYVKNNATLIFLPNSHPGSYMVVYEPLATIINQSGEAFYDSVICSSIVFPPVSCTVGIEEAFHKPALKISPNPCNGKFTISGFSNSGKTVTIEITDIAGSVFIKQQATIDNEIAELNLQLNNGVYFMRTIDENGSVQLHKIVISH